MGAGCTAGDRGWSMTVIAGGLARPLEQWDNVEYRLYRVGFQSNEGTHTQSVPYLICRYMESDQESIPARPIGVQLLAIGEKPGRMSCSLPLISP